MLYEHFVKDMETLPHNAMLVPLGDTVIEVVKSLREQGFIPQEIMKFEGRFVAPPHPSPENKESINLLIEPVYPTEEAYTERMYRKYLARLKKDEKPQNEHTYKKARATRWKSMLFVRRAYGLQ